MVTTRRTGGMRSGFGESLACEMYGKQVRHEAPIRRRESRVDRVAVTGIVSGCVPSNGSKSTENERYLVPIDRSFPFP